VLGSSSLAMSGARDSVDQVTDEQVHAHLQRFPGDGRLTGRTLRSLVHYQITHPQFRSRVPQVPSTSAAVATTPTPQPQGWTDDEFARSGVSQAEIDAHLEYYPQDS
jgi:hypothetical protein